ncbi:MAG: hypothetical protein ACKOHK_14420, partial [Planctomycetia bacterium]
MPAFPLHLESHATKRPAPGLRSAASAFFLVLSLLLASEAHAQMGGMGGGGMGGGGMGGGGAGGGRGGGGMTAGGIIIDANGVLRTRLVADAGLSGERLKNAMAALPADLQTKSPLRK